MAINPETATKMLELLSTINPTPVEASAELLEWWKTKGLPEMRDGALSQLYRTNHYKPTLIGFMEGGSVGVIDLQKACGGEWGDQRSKQATAHVQRISALIPGTYATVFGVEVWVGHNVTEEERKKLPDGSLEHHPNSTEALMFSLLHYEHETNTMMQLSTMIDVIKVLGKNVSPRMWRETKLGEPMIIDPNKPLADGRKPLRGRFIYGDKDEDEGS